MATRSEGFEFKYTQPTQGQGFYTNSGGLQAGQTVNVPVYINTSSRANGTYASTAILQFLNPITSKWDDGPTISYSITLTD